MPLTVQHIERRIEMIRGLGRDFEAQHSEEDQLFAEVLRAISQEESLENARDLAEAALKCLTLNFVRVYA